METRLQLYQAKVWACQSTAKTGMTFQEAQLSEANERASLVFIYLFYCILKFNFNVFAVSLLLFKVCLVMVKYICTILFETY